MARSVLRSRVIASLVLAPGMILMLLYLPSFWLAIFIGIVSCAAAWEWASLVEEKLVAKLFYVVVCALLIIAAGNYLPEEHVRFLMLMGSAFWVFVLLMLTFYQPSWLGNYLLQGFLTYSGYFVIVVAWLAMVKLNQQKPSLLLFLFLIVWMADTAAYFAGKRFGKNKLAEQLSPGKTREGLLGAVIGTFILSLAGVWWFELNIMQSVYFVLLCVLTALISVVGDLFESLLKRNAGAKDSGSLIPGHGGVLDRIDSILAAAPGFVLGMYWLY